MSIPPFVCNTPPPPEVCEDDIDVDYDDIHYHLSQEEDDSNDLGFGVTTYNYSNTTRLSPKNHNADLAPVNTTVESENHFKSKPENTLAKDNIGDLTLDLENISINNSDQQIDNESRDSASTSDFSDFTLYNNNTYDETSNLNGIEESNIEINKDSFIDQDKVVINEETSSIVEKLYNEAVCEVVEAAEALQNLQVKTKADLDIEEPATIVSSNQNEVLQLDIDDDFGDFEDFKVSSSNEPPTPIDDFNPWQTEACTEQQFEATFDSSGFGESAVETATAEDDDDFGDFDDFRSNTNVEHTDCESMISSSLTSVNEAVINKVIYSLFEEELLEPENSNVKKLESSLSETWRHLQQVEERQPYMVNWNNSVTQKALLKALCIDSRNILFVPKWGSNTPRYAANLCTTPLQPLKPSTAIESSVSDPPPTSTNSWVQQSSQDGQETTYAEAILLDLENLMATLDQMAHNQSALKISEFLSQACNPEESAPPAPVHPTLLTAADLDILDVPNTSNKVYPGPTHVQPIRQISLPDTHIFTPSNSETPRSKTIHYDFGPTILMPKPGNVPVDDDDFSDFQDFKRSPENNGSRNAGTIPTITSVEATKLVLEPIRMDVVPSAINWPEPGQIKETFDVFSDFISVDNVETITPARSQTTITNSIFSSVVPNLGPSVSNDQFDDDFDNFQSAISSETSIGINVDPMPVVKQIDSTISQANGSNVKPITKDDFLPNSNTAMNNFQIEPTNFNSIPPKINHTSPPALEILQPLSINTQYSHKSNSGQILQPLSLESYSQINWPNPGNLQDLSRFNPIETVPTLKNDGGSASGSKHASPARLPKSYVTDDDGWGDFVSSKPKQQVKPLSTQHKQPICDEDEWSDFVSSSTVKPTNGVNTISFNVHTNQNIQKTPSSNSKSSNQISIDVPTLNYITPKSNNQNVYSSKHLNL